MKKKYMSKRKWDRLFDEALNKVAPQDENGVRNVPAEKFFDEFWHAADFLDDYTVIGVGYQIKKVRDRITERLFDRKMRNLKLGKLKYSGPPWHKFEFKIEGMSEEFWWNMNIYLAVIIRDYLRLYADKTFIIGNCVAEKYYEKDDFDPAKGLPDEAFDEWKELVKDTANEFDELLKLTGTKFDVDSKDWPEYEKQRDSLTKKAFADLAKIYADLVD